MRTITSPRVVSLAIAAAIVTTVATILLSAPAAALEPSGHAVKVNPAVNATGPGGERMIVLQGAVFMGDVIVANPNGLAQIRFVDNTRLVVAPNSRLTIDTFVFNPDMTARKVTVNLIKGSLRFISGNSRPEAYTIRTPTMSIGIRG